MAKEINIGQNYQAAGAFELERGEDGVRATAKREYTDRFLNWRDRCPGVGSRHPNYSGLRLCKISANVMPGDMVRVVLYYESERNSYEFGVNEEDEYEMDYSCSELPLLSHPYFESVSGDEKDALLAMVNGSTSKDTFGDEGKVIAEAITSEPGKYAMKLIQEGVVSFLAPGGVYGITTTSASLSLSGVGKKGTPAGAPSVSGKYNWLKEGVRGRKTGNAMWRQTISYRLSGPKGWDGKLY